MLADEKDIVRATGHPRPHDQLRFLRAVGVPCRRNAKGRVVVTEDDLRAWINGQQDDIDSIVEDWNAPQACSG